MSDFECIRELASKYFVFPTKRSEDWKYCELSDQFVEEGVVKSDLYKELECSNYDVLFVNGCVDYIKPDLFRFLRVSALNSDSFSDLDLSKCCQHALLLNLKNIQSGLSFEINSEELVNLKIVYSGDFSAMYTQNIFRVCKGGKLNLIEKFLGSKCLSNNVSRVFAYEGAIVEHCVIQDSDISNTNYNYLKIASYDDVVYQLSLVNLGSALCRTQVSVDILGRGVNFNCDGAVLTNAKQHSNILLTIDHHVKGSYSSQTFRQVLSGMSTGVIHGRVNVCKGASKTQSEQSIKSLSLDGSAQAFLRPELNIYNDDVLCTHGATTGFIDEDAIYYMTARGIAKSEAKRFFILAFLRGAINEAFAEYINPILNDKFISSM